MWAGLRRVSSRGGLNCASRWGGVLRCSAALVLLASHAASAQPVQTIPTISSMANEIYTISHQDMSWRGHPYRVFMATPRLGQTRQDNVTALYILDGNAQFPLAVNAVLAHWTPLPQADKATQARALPVIVGLGYPEDKAYPLAARTRDYTYAAPGEAFAAGGGAADFYDFLRYKVRPYIHRQLTTDPDRQILAGHSFGGLFALYVLLNHPDAFDNYVIGSPSLWWGNGAIVSGADGRAPSILGQKTTMSEEEIVESGRKTGVSGRRAAVSDMAAATVGNTYPVVGKNTRVTILQGEYEENPKADPAMTPERLARMAQRRSPINARSLDRWLQAQGVHSEFTLVERSGHGGVIPATISAAVRDALKQQGR